MLRFELTSKGVKKLFSWGYVIIHTPAGEPEKGFSTEELCEIIEQLSSLPPDALGTKEQALLSKLKQRRKELVESEL